MRAPQHFILVSMLVMGLSACNRAVQPEPQWGSCSGARPLPGDSTLGLVYELQGEWHGSTVVRPVFVILWKSGINSGTTWGCGGEPTNSAVAFINGHRLTVSNTNRAVCALQPDYTLKDIGLPEPALSTVLNAIAKGAPIEDNLWTNRLAPRLCFIQ